MTLRALVLTFATLIIGTPVTAQWTNRYPKVDGLNHHVYLEGYELPTLTIGPIDPAPSPAGPVGPTVDAPKYSSYN